MRDKKRWREINRMHERLLAKKYGKRSYNRAGKRGSKKLKRERIRNKKLCKRYPWLIPRSRWTDEFCWVKRQYDHTELDAVSNGWRKAFGDIWCEEIHKILVENDFVDQFRIMQLKEKYGQFRQYLGIAPKEVHDLTNAFEVISEHVCHNCGTLDVHVINDYGWYLPLCEKCYNKSSERVSKLNRVTYIERLEEAEIDPDEKIPTSYTIHTWSKDKGEEMITYDMSELVQKIRYKNRKRQKHE